MQKNPSTISTGGAGTTGTVITRVDDAFSNLALPSSFKTGKGRSRWSLYFSGTSKSRVVSVISKSTVAADFYTSKSK